MGVEFDEGKLGSDDSRRGLEQLRRLHPDLIDRDEAMLYLIGNPVHDAARSYYDPFDPWVINNWVGAISGSYQLVVAALAACLVLFKVRQRRQQAKQEEKLNAQKQRLNRFLDRVIAIEADQIDIKDANRLSVILDEVTSIKLEALHELSGDELRGDAVLAIFLMQCSSLIEKMQLKIIVYGGETLAAQGDKLVEGRVVGE